ncbi:MAG TPA: glycosyltransferase family 2 protein [Thermoanaerobaculia bacterium]|nr:glycosyltransferase family 2 protein [Thermoanaerobaculia bacterium]
MSNVDLDVDVIVLDLDGGDLLQKCLNSIEAQTLKPSRILVWDNGSRTPVTTRLPPLPGSVEVHRSEANLGFAGGVNAAFALASADFIALVNNDVLLDPRWLSALLERMKVDDKVCAVQSLILAPDGTIDGAGIDVSSGTFRQIAHGASPTVSFELKPWGVSATATLYRRSALVDVLTDGQLFDPRFFAYYEDVELCARLGERGWLFAVVPEPLATHKGSASSSHVEAVYLRTRNRYWVHRLHGAVGSYGALLREDLRLLVRDVAGLQPGNALSRCRGLLEGLLTNIEN